MVTAFIVMVVGLVMPSAWDALSGSAHGRAADIAHRLGDALLVAGAIALVLDVPAKMAINKAIVEGVMWGLINPEAPPRHRKMLRKLASAKTVVSTATWTIRLEHIPDKPKLLHLTIALEASGTSYEDKGKFPTKPMVVLASSDGEWSRYKHYQLKKNSGKILLEVDEEAFADAERDMTFVSRRRDGGVEFKVKDAKRRLGRGDLVSGDGFQHASTVEVFRHQRGFFPMWSDFTTGATTIKLKGSALETHHFTLARLDDKRVFTWNRQDGGSAVFHVNELPPACALILSWSRIEDQHARTDGSPGPSAVAQGA